MWGLRAVKDDLHVLLVREFWVTSRTFMHLGDTGAKEQMYGEQYEDFGLVHSRVVLHVGCPGEDIQ